MFLMITLITYPDELIQGVIHLNKLGLSAMACIFSQLLYVPEQCVS